MTGKQQLFPNCFESVVRCPSPPSRRRQLREILVQSTPLECTDRWSGMGRGEWGEAPCQDDFASNPPPFPSGITEHWSPIVSIGFSFHRRSIPSLFLSSPPQQFLDTTRLLPDQDTREVGEHARKGKFPYGTFRCSRYLPKSAASEICTRWGRWYEHRSHTIYINPFSTVVFTYV